MQLVVDLLSYFCRFLYFPSFLPRTRSFAIRFCHAPAYSVCLLLTTDLAAYSRVCSFLLFRRAWALCIIESRVLPPPKKRMHLCYRPVPPPVNDDLQLIKTCNFQLCAYEERTEFPVFCSLVHMSLVSMKQTEI